MSRDELFKNFDEFVDNVQDNEIKERLRNIVESLFHDDAGIRLNAFRDFDDILDDISQKEINIEDYENLHKELWEYYDKIEDECCE